MVVDFNTVTFSKGVRHIFGSDTQFCRKEADHVGGEINFGKKIFSEYIYIDILVQVKGLDINTILNNEVLVKQT